MSNDHDFAALRRTAEPYARGADRRDKDIWRSVMAANIVVTGPGFVNEGLEANLGSIDYLATEFKATRHLIHDQVMDVNGDTASGETVSTAEHLLIGPNGADLLLCWAIRYQDQLVRDAASPTGWRFTRRDLIVDWKELRPILSAGPLA